MPDDNFAELDEFARFYGFHYDLIDGEVLIRDCLNDMERGLRGLPSDVPMRPSYISPAGALPPGKTVVALDAGGTNLRAALVRVDDAGRLAPGETRRAPMPGTQGRLSAKAFFNQVADLIIPLFDEAGTVDGIGFCFAYSIDIADDADGVLVAFCKEVDAPEVVGTKIGAGLRAALEARGCKVPQRIVLLNDTVATLLSGYANLPPSEHADAVPMLGFILGTGSNIAYPEKAIPKISFYSEASPQIINTETCSFRSRFIGVLDKEFDATTMCPGTYMQDKACAGAYLGPLTVFAAKQAVRDRVIRFRRADEFLALSGIDTSTFNSFLLNPLSGGMLGGLFGKDEKNAVAAVLYLAQIVTERAALLSAAVLAATAERMNAGANPLNPLRITIEGSTYKMYKGMKEALDARLHALLGRKSPRSCIIMPADQASLFGAAIAALSK